MKSYQYNEIRSTIKDGKIKKSCKKTHIPNKETLRSMELTSKGEGLIEHNTLEEMIEDSKKW